MAAPRDQAACVLKGPRSPGVPARCQGSSAGGQARPPLSLGQPGDSFPPRSLLVYSTWLCLLSTPTSVQLVAPQGPDAHHRPRETLPWSPVPPVTRGELLLRGPGPEARPLLT